VTHQSLPSLKIIIMMDDDNGITYLKTEI
jgi:hypothetical protein